MPVQVLSPALTRALFCNELVKRQTAEGESVQRSSSDPPALGPMLMAVTHAGGCHAASEIPNAWRPPEQGSDPSGLVGLGQRWRGRPTKTINQ
jgi:hypothetical protein